jgi:hypothetical protein
MIRSPLCSRCHMEPRQGRQRWCRRCRSTHERERRRRRRQLAPQRRRAPEPTGPVLPPGVADLGYGARVCGEGAEPDWPRGCAQRFPARRSGQLYCCQGCGGGSRHTADCPLLQARMASPVPPRRVERPAIVAAGPASAWAPIRSTPERRATGATKGKRRGLWDPAEIERRKRLIARIPKSQRPPSEYRVATFMADNGHTYVDLRVYKGSAGQLPTRTGLPIHIDKLPDVIEALRDALRREAQLGPAAPRGSVRDEWAPVAELVAEDVDGWAAEGMKPGPAVDGRWDIDGGWGLWR